MTLRILVLDIETGPDVSVHFGRFNQNIGLAQTLIRGGTICYAAKWLGERKVEFWSDWDQGHDAMVKRAHGLLCEADAVVHFNGKSFDEKHLNREFALARLGPTSPYKPIDLVLTARRRFRFTSNKLDNLLAEFGLTRKLDTGGIELWVEAIDYLGQFTEAERKRARRLMRRYNVQDVRSTEELYRELMPWIVGHPNPGLYSDDTDVATCHCGSTDLQKRGPAYTALGKFQQWYCKSCGAWPRGGKRLDHIDLRSVS